MADNLQRAAFPLFAPDSLDVILVWECPGSGRRGHHHLVDLAFFQSGMLALDNSSTIVELPNAAAPSRDQNGKVAREQAQAAHKIESALQDPDLAPVAAPISVVQSVDAILEHPSGARWAKMSSFVLFVCRKALYRCLTGVLISHPGPSLP